MHGDGSTRRRLETEPEFGFRIIRVVTIFASNRAFILTYLYFTFLHFISEHKMYLTILTILLGVCSHVSSGIFCYVCESVRDFRCLDPFDFQPFPQVNTLIRQLFLLFQALGSNLQALLCSLISSLSALIKTLKPGSSNFLSKKPKKCQQNKDLNVFKNFWEKVSSTPSSYWIK